MKIVIQLVLWVVIGFLGYLVFNSVMGPVRFNKVKEVRYAKVVENLRDIRTAQLAYRSITGKFEKNPEKLITFIDTAKFTLTQRRDSSFIRFNKILKIDEPKDTVVVDTLGYASVKDSLFKTGSHKSMLKIPIAGVDAKFDLDAGFINKNDLRIPVFEAKVAKDVLLHDLDKDLLAQEKEVVSVDGVNGAFLSVGSMIEVKTSGNWPMTYGANDQ
ncbi:hypothetical protein D1816_06615 [Aquimarina sp. AD10]|uniref:Uncharacterized protein n=1 Tax=Aquimarina aggregata TaxID=1642818 RepID=A0A163C1D2_9FLAO|nr:MULTISPECIES: hypothetical protein [Aquimarina]AXT60039.1 hypothetical protein D1816_06615 [Aquimarina sp. AD10]KZS41971.1 hypothetical protein AWE51_00585 [Aquimarina aggregata]RKM96181.1 hypothetical protein D7033_15805 [Aquimarina sp. AD10]